MPDTLTPAQEQVIVLLSTGSTLAAAAQAAGVHRNTIANWRRTSPAFAQSLAEARYDRALHFRELAEEHAELAIATIHYLLADLDTPPGIRLKAALAILKEATTPPPPEPAATRAGEARNPASPLLPDPSPVHSPQPECAPEMHNLAQSRTTDTYRRSTPKVGRNEPCPCGSGRKYKQCCLLAMAA